MHARKLLAAGVAAAAVAAGAAAAAAPAAAAPAAHAKATGGLSFIQVTHRHGRTVLKRTNLPNCGSNIYIVLTNDVSKNVTGQGLGNAATIETNSGSEWNVTCPTGGVAFHPVGEPTHCLIEANTSHGGDVISTTNCSVARRVWVFPDVGGEGSTDWISNWDNSAVYTVSNAAGDKLHYTDAPLQQGSWANWADHCQSGC